MLCSKKNPNQDYLDSGDPLVCPRLDAVFLALKTAVSQAGLLTSGLSYSLRLPGSDASDVVQHSSRLQRRARLRISRSSLLNHKRTAYWYLNINNLSTCILEFCQ